MRRQRITTGQDRHWSARVDPTCSLRWSRSMRIAASVRISLMAVARAAMLMFVYRHRLTTIVTTPDGKQGS